MKGDPGRRATVAAIIGSVAVLVAWHTLRVDVPEGVRVAASLGVAAAVLLGIAQLAAMKAGELGLERQWLGRGAVVGGAAVGVLLVVFTVVVAIPAWRGAFDDSRGDITLPRMLVQAFVEIPLGTVVLEEVAFRGVLLGLLLRLFPIPWAVALASLMFGVWHLGPGSYSVGIVVITTIGGVVACALRLWSHSLVAPALAHIGTNSLALAASWVVTRVL